MKATTPEKHKTPNYKLHTVRVGRRTISAWKPVPLRSTRKDLNALSRQ